MRVFTSLAHAMYAGRRLVLMVAGAFLAFAAVWGTGAIITSAALLLIVVIGAFATSGITFIKLIGVAMVIAIAIDATIVRVLLVPATMRLLGARNWWAPRPLRRLHDRFGRREDEPTETDPAPPGPVLSRGGLTP